jgi:hypothetical protein
MYLRKRLRAVTERLGKLEEERRDFVAALPQRVQRRIGQPVSRVSRATPWAMWAADTLMIANAYGLFGTVALPFPQSEYLSNGVQLVRAAAVSFGLTFGLKMVGNQARGLAEELRERWQPAGMVSDAIVATTVVGTAVMLALSAAQLQQAFLKLATGGSEVHLPTSVLFWIVAFLGAVSFAVGYFGNEPELARVAVLDASIAATRSELDAVTEQLAVERGVGRGLRAKRTAIDERERLELAEQAAHTERRVYAHLAGNVPVYGLPVASEAARVPGKTA